MESAIFLEPQLYFWENTSSLTCVYHTKGKTKSPERWLVLRSLHSSRLAVMVWPSFQRLPVCFQAPSQPTEPHPALWVTTVDLHLETNLHYRVSWTECITRALKWLKSDFLKNLAYVNKCMTPWLQWTQTHLHPVHRGFIYHLFYNYSKTNRSYFCRKKEVFILTEWHPSYKSIWGKKETRGEQNFIEIRALTESLNSSLATSFYVIMQPKQIPIFEPNKNLQLNGLT